MTIKFEVFRVSEETPTENDNTVDKRTQHYFRIKGANGETLAQSEGYSRVTDCNATVDLIKREAADARVEAVK